MSKDNKRGGWDANSVPSNPDTITDSIVPNSPSRPARQGGKRSADSGGLLLPILILVGFCGLGYGVYLAAFAKGDSEVAGAVANAVKASKEVAESAQAVVQTKIRQPELAPKGQRNKRGPAFAKEERAAAERYEKQRKELAKRGLTPPLLTTEVDKAFGRIKGRVQSCYKKHYAKLGNFHRVRVDAEIAPDGRVTTAALIQEGSNPALDKCVSVATKRIRFRGKREGTESHQLYMTLGQVKSIRK